MPHKPSVILTPSEKKEAITFARDNLKFLQLQLNDAAKTRKKLDDDYKHAVTNNNRLVATINKAILKAQRKYDAAQ